MFFNPVPPPPDFTPNGADYQDLSDSDLLFMMDVDNDFDQMNLFSESGSCESFSCGSAHCNAHLCFDHKCNKFGCESFEDQTEQPEPPENPDQPT